MVTKNPRRAFGSTTCLAAIFGCALSMMAVSRAEAAPPAETATLPTLPTPLAHHAPIATAKAHEDLRIIVTLDHPEVIKSAGVIYRVNGGELRIVPLLRGEGEGFVAVIPAGELVAPSLAYGIEIERIDGRRIAAFGTRADLQTILVQEERMDIRERVLLKRLEGRRSVITTTGEFVRFGRTDGRTLIPCGAKQTTCTAGSLVRPSVDDQYWRVEAGYTYRPLRAVAEFGLRIGVVRGSSLVDASVYDASTYKVGLNYASPSVRFRLGDSWHVDLSALTSISENGFSVGGGIALAIGDPYGTHLTLGTEAVGISRDTYFGSRFYGRFDLQVHPRIIVAPVIEITDMPHAEAFGVRLFSDVTANIGRGFSLGIRGGYQARKSTSGGIGLGGTASLAF